MSRTINKDSEESLRKKLKNLQGYYVLGMGCTANNTFEKDMMGYRVITDYNGRAWLDNDLIYFRGICYESLYLVHKSQIEQALKREWVVPEEIKDLTWNPNNVLVTRAITL